MRRVNFHVVWQGQDFLVQRIVELAREIARIFIRIAQVGPADVVHEEQVAGEDRGRFVLFPNEKGKTIRRMARRLEQFDLERADLDPRAIFPRDVLVMHRCVLRDVNFGAGALRQLAKAGGEIGVRMTIEDRDDLESFALRLLQVIFDIPFRIDHGGFTVGAEEIGSVGESFDKKAFQIHKRVLVVRFGLKNQAMPFSIPRQ